MPKAPHAPQLTPWGLQPNMARGRCPLTRRRGEQAAASREKPRGSCADDPASSAEVGRAGQRRPP
eukprot:12251920-Alexandrium_andersonii.AAC.1